MSARSVREQQRELSRRKRASARTLATAFPAVEGIRVELTFEVLAGRAPTRQSHLMYPPAPAYFQFDCPYGDCDGGFDLNDAAVSMMTHSTPWAEGTLVCPGTRAGAGMSRQPCCLRTHYRIAVQYVINAGSPA
jgi:hypothetical protein